MDTTPKRIVEGNCTSWDMSQERQFMENLLCQRFNFFLVVFAAVVAGALAADERWELLMVQWIGLIISVVMAITLWRSQLKLDLIISELKRDDQHPVAVIDKRARGFSARWMIGYLIPPACCLFQMIMLTISHCTSGQLHAGR